MLFQTVFYVELLLLHGAVQRFLTTAALSAQPCMQIGCHCMFFAATVMLHFHSQGNDGSPHNTAGVEHRLQHLQTVRETAAAAAAAVQW
jgi:hypothetical protein